MRNYRNYADEEVTFNDGVNVFVGPNSSGKTNLLHAAYLTAYGSTLRGRDVEAIRWNQSEASVEGKYLFEAGVEKTARVVLKPGQKDIYLGGKKLSGRRHLVGSFPVVITGAWDFRIVEADPQSRRRFLDAVLTLLSPSYLSPLRDYHRALRQRNLILAQVTGRGRAEIRKQLDPWTESLVRYGSVIWQKRESVISWLLPHFTVAYKSIARQDGDCSLEYKPNVRAKKEENFAEALRRAYNSRYEREVRRGMSLAGPHLDDVVIKVGGVELRKFGSRGEMKTALVALRVAEAMLIAQERGEKPAILLDDAFSDLDDERAHILLAAQRGFQLILTSAEEDRARRILKSSERVDTSLFEVDRGSVQQRLWSS